MEKIKNAIAYVFGVLVVLLAGAAFYFKRRADNAETDALMGETRGEDKQLKRQQDEIQAEIDKVKNEDSSQLTPDQRASRWDK